MRITILAAILAMAGTCLMPSSSVRVAAQETKPGVQAPPKLAPPASPDPVIKRPPEPPPDGEKQIHVGFGVGTEVTKTAGATTTVVTRGAEKQETWRLTVGSTQKYHRDEAGQIDKVTNNYHGQVDNKDSHGEFKPGWTKDVDGYTIYNAAGGGTAHEATTSTLYEDGRKQSVEAWVEDTTYDAAKQLQSGKIVHTKDGVVVGTSIWDPEKKKWISDTKGAEQTSGPSNPLASTVTGGNGRKIYFYFEGTIVSTSGCTGVFYHAAPTPGPGSGFNLIGNMWLRGGTLYATNGLGEISASPEYAGVLRSDGTFYVRSKPNYAGQRSQINGHLSAQGQISGKWDRVFDGYCVDRLRITYGHGPSPARLQRRPTTRSKRM